MPLGSASNVHPSSRATCRPIMSSRWRMAKWSWTATCSTPAATISIRRISSSSRPIRCSISRRHGPIHRIAL